MSQNADGLAFEQVTTDYLESLRHERHCAQTTYYTYQSWLRAFQKWLEGEGHPVSLTSFCTPILRTYQYSLSKRGLRPRTIRGAFHGLTGLGEFLVSHHVISENPCKALRLPRKDAAIRLTVSQEEISALLGGAGRLHPMRRASLARAVVYTLVCSGVRFQELLDLKVQHVDLSTGSLLVASGKGSKSRLLYAPQDCMEAIKAWLIVRGECSHDWLWAENKGRRMGDMGVRDLLEEVKAVSGLRGRDNIKPHSLRHAYASRMLSNGASLKVIQTALGHNDIKSSSVYLHLDEREAMKMAEYAAVRPAQTQEAPHAAPNTQIRQKASQFTRQRRETRR